MEGDVPPTSAPEQNSMRSAPHSAALRAEARLKQAISRGMTCCCREWFCFKGVQGDVKREAQIQLDVIVLLSQSLANGNACRHQCNPQSVSFRTSSPLTPFFLLHRIAMYRGVQNA